MHYTACRLVAWLCWVSCLLAQAPVVRLQNHGPFPFSGWLRTTVDTDPGATGTLGGDATGLWVRGRSIGRDAWAVDLLVDLPAGAQRTAKLIQGKPLIAPPALPSDVLVHFGGPVVVSGAVAQIVDGAVDGAALTAHLRARHGRALVTDAWITWYPGQAWAAGEVLTAASNPSIPDATTSEAPVVVQFGDAVTVLAGAVRNVTSAADTWADGQGRAVPVLFVWPRLLARGSDWSSVGALADDKLGAVGITRLWRDGWPATAPSVAPIDWARRVYEPSRKALMTWDAPPLGPVANSAQTGAQPDQVFVVGEPATLPGAEIPIYWSALALAKRPCQHREPDGSMLDPARHVEPRLILWDMRPHWHTGVSPDRLGKARDVTMAETRGWWGADVEHLLCNTLASAHRLKASPACDYLLQQLARQYPLQWTTTPGWSTSQPYAARAIGWEALFVLWCDGELEDRALAARVVAHWRVRLHDVIAPALRARGDWWDVRLDDPRLGPGLWAIAWQQSVGAYGLVLAGQHLGEPDAVALGAAGARVVLERAWQRDAAGLWHASPQLPVSGVAPIDDSFRYFGMALAPAAVLRVDPTQRARDLMQWLVANAKEPSHFSWLPPEVVR